ncbi:hypothetical protein E0485_05735 [Paenibacillus albiflavus]|uniref:Uncharacterized protein n=1 Tax=Paenibacillus albiflavus TaxID=2545760 RepID=A0A4R4ELN1_9BACL|nr:hypothetical protein [Paenibacillus albiflavus]TCZ79361.1 hypothetical protein E0485_05735 [Paenibacillus albiflavus]
MDTIQFKVEYSEDQDAQVLGIYINGENLVELIRRYENQFDPSIAGGYEGLNIKFLNNIKEHFTGKLNEDDLFYYEGKTLIMGCNCGEPGCWPILIKVIEEDEVIVWNEFEQPHRNEESASGHWDYSKFKPLRFNRKQYEEQLKIICEKLKEDDNST